MKMPLPVPLPAPAIDPPEALNVPPCATYTAPPDAALSPLKLTELVETEAPAATYSAPPVPPGADMAVSVRSEMLTEPLLTTKPPPPPPSITAERLVLSALSPWMLRVSPAARLIAGI